ncbi:mechanosensitive ion channel domain-containing protein [Tundrisphaera lichenicola]|uniref:mechanosensitive ion channel domain-containing protein n=1 Tax=Tundrisphaera lichenicola TaxID=2029860 RepID=UPI003EB959B6
MRVYLLKTEGLSPILAVGLILGAVGPSPAQVPGLPAEAKPAAPPAADPSEKAIPAKDNPGSVFSATSGPIQVNQKIDDEDIRSTLGDLLDQFPGVRSVSVEVRDGVVKLDGHAGDDETISQVTAFTKKVEGVRLVLNRMKTDAEVLTGRELLMQVIGQYREILARNWLLALLALGFVMGFGAIARVFARYSETLLSPFLGNALLRSVVGSILSSLIVLAGILLGLSVLNLTQAVVSVLGLASIVGLALGFAFRDIAENFIASMLLGLRRPFQIGDFVMVAGKSGSVLSLDTRATTLITPEGNHVRIPNAVIYKETLINLSSTPNTLGTIEVMVPYEASIAEALQAINQALESMEGLLKTPSPRALVQALEVGGVRLKATYWMPTRGIDGDKLQSDLRLKIKVALQQAGIASATNQATLSVAGRVPVELIEAASKGPTRRGEINRPSSLAESSESTKDRQVQDNLRKDTQAAESAAGPVEPEASPIDHAIQQAVVEAAADGNNMLANGNS